MNSKLRLILRSSQYDLHLITCYTILSILAFIISITVGLTDNEAYYWSWSLKPDLSYFDHPPLHAWGLTFLGNFLPKSNLAVRLPALLGLWVTTYYYIKSASRFNVSWRLPLALIISAPVFFVFSWISLPDVLLFPLCLITIDLTYKRYYSLAGLTYGLALLAKWHAILLVPGLIFLIIIQESTNFRRFLNLSIAMTITGLLQLPVLLWNWQHDWISLKYHLYSRHIESSPSITDLISRTFTFWGGYALFGGIIFMYLAYNFFRFFRFKKSLDPKENHLLIFALPFIVMFYVSAMKGQSRIYWTAFSYFPLSILFFRYLSSERVKLIYKLSIKSAFVLSIILISVVNFPIGSYLKNVWSAVVELEANQHR